jgi:hypothetical protein
MNRGARHLALAAAALALLLIVSLTFRTNPPNRETTPYENLIRNNRVALSNYIADVLAGRAQKHPGATVFSPPSVSHHDLSLAAVSVDQNTNIYFVSNRSFTTFNVGIVYSPFGKPLLGDGMEPRIVWTVRLEDGWYCYKSQ